MEKYWKSAKNDVMFYCEPMND